MLFFITAPPGVGKTLLAVMKLKEHHEKNLKNIPISQDYYMFNLEHLSNNADKLITVDLAEFKGNQNLFVEIRTALSQHDGKQISLIEYFGCFNNFDFSEFCSDKVTPKHYYLSTMYNLIANFANKMLDTKFKMIPPVRQIYADINGLRVPDVLESPDDWRTCPDGSIIFYDEVQNRPIYKNTKTKDPIIEELTIHRHRGFDIYFITQFPVLVHTEVRAVIGQHFHLFRPWGLPQAFVHVWSYCVVDPNSFSKKRAAERTFRFSYPKDIYKLYTSSTMHTHKITLPKKLFMFGGFALFGLYLIYDGISGGTVFNKKTTEVTSKVDNAKDAIPFASQNTKTNDQISPELAQKINSCVDQFKWSVEQCREAYDPVYLEKTRAQRTSNTFIYDATKPYATVNETAYQATVQPVFSGCIKYNGKYVAYTQQGTKLDVSEADCKRLIDDGDRPFNYFAQTQTNQPVQQTQTIQQTQNEEATGEQI